MRFPLALTLSSLAVAGAACGSNGSYGTSNNPPPTLTADIHVVPGAPTKGALAFSPNPDTVSLAAGGTLSWGNFDNTTHTVTGDGASPAFSSGNLAVGKKFTFTFTVAGDYTYHCTIHPTMTGKVVVIP
jgi:plastocyanin